MTTPGDEAAAPMFFFMVSEEGLGEWSLQCHFCGWSAQGTGGQAAMDEASASHECSPAVRT